MSFDPTQRVEERRVLVLARSLILSLAAILIMMLLMGAAPASAYAFPASYILPANPAYSGGSGTQADPYQLASSEDMFTLSMASANDPAYSTGRYFELVGDIDLSASPLTAAWEPIDSFEGVFDGKGHVIRNMHIENVGHDNAGLFGSATAGAVVKNLVVKGDITTTSHYVGGIVGNGTGGTFTNLGSEVTIVLQGRCSTVGGVVGSGHILERCYNKGDITGTASVSMGGVVGDVSSRSGVFGHVTSCYNWGTITAVADPRQVFYLAGVVSGYYNSYSGGATVNNCYNAGRLEAATPAESGTGAVKASDFPGTNNFYLEGTYTSDQSVSTVLVTGEELAAVPAALGADYVAGNRYPVLAWEQEKMGAPVIVTQPSEGWSVTGAQAAEMSVEAALPQSDKPAVSTSTGLVYQWYAGTAPDGSGATAVSGATSARYAPPTTTLGVSYYYCIITNTWTGGTGGTSGSASTTSNIVAHAIVSSTVPTAPAFTTSPPSTASYQTGASAAALSVAATIPGGGAGTLSYQWYLGAAAEPSPASDTPIYAATQPTFTPSTAQAPGVYYYYCVATTTLEGVKTTSTTSSVASIELTAVKIATPAELLAFSQAVNAGNSYAGVTVELAADIDLTEICSSILGVNWVPVGTADNCFSGVFDGKGHRITNLYYVSEAVGTYADGPYPQALFGFVHDATLKNFVVQGRVSAKFYSMAGVASVATGKTLIENVGSEVELIANNIINSQHGGCVGGIVGRASGAVTIRYCYNKGAISGSATSIGGILGRGAGVVIDGCYNTADLDTGASTDVGGIVGQPNSVWAYLTDFGMDVIKNCYNVGKINTTPLAATYHASGAIAGTAWGGETRAFFWNNYYRLGSYVDSVGMRSESPVPSDAETNLVRTTAEMFSPNIIGELNDGGSFPYVFVPMQYPILYWEDTELTDLTESGYSLALADSLEYDGSFQEPEVTVVYGAAILPSNNYTLSYSNNRDAGQATVTVTGANYYTGTLQAVFTIEPAPLTIRPDDASKQVGAPDPSSFAYTVTGLKGTDTLTGLAVARQAGETTGQYPIVASDAVLLDEERDGNKDVSGNYAITYQEGTFTVHAADKAALQAAFTSAETIKNSTVISLNGDDVPVAGYWVIQRVYDDLSGAIESARAALDDPNATQERVDQGLSSLATARAAFDAARRQGVKPLFPPDTEWKRLFGAVRYDTMEAIVAAGFTKNDTDTVIVATGENFPDALAASSLAGLTKAPIVLTVTERLSVQARRTIEALEPSTIYIIGSASVVSSATQSELERLVARPENVKRVAGPDRYATAVEIFKEGASMGWGSTAIIACAQTFPDALSVSPYAYVEKAPIFLADRDSGLNAASIAAIKSGGFTKMLLVGDEKVVPNVVISQLGLTSGQYERLGGADRYKTSAIIAEYLVANTTTLGYHHLVTATGRNFPDALAGAAFAGKTGTVLILVDEGTVGIFGIDRIVKAHAQEIGDGYFLGSETVLSAGLAATLQQAARQ
jgi:putative cell wall-binding protein